MGIRSDVFFAHKSSIQLPQEYADMLVKDFRAKVLHHAEGTAYSMEYVEWYAEDDDQLIQFYNFLDNENITYSDFIVIEACLDYPEGVEDGGDSGAWYNNPWGAKRYVRTGIDFDPCPAA